MFSSLAAILICLNSCTTLTSNQKKTAPVLESQSKITTHILQNDYGVSVEILNLGGIIKSIKVPNKQGEFEDIVLGFDNANDYLNTHPYFGAIVGRYANRIANGSFSIDNTTYTLVYIILIAFNGVFRHPLF